MKKIKNIILMLFVSLIFVSCATAPLTGRRQIKFVSDESVVQSSVAQYNQMIAQLRANNLLANNTAQGKRVAQIGRRVTGAVEKYLRENPEARMEWERDFKLKNDPRVTPIGEFLRRTSLDELPQIFNVLKGEMSLVGPRPIVQEEVPRYGIHIKKYYSVKPGITGLWQVSGRSDISYSERVALDVEYVVNRSFLKDIQILIKTFDVVFRKKGAY